MESSEHHCFKAVSFRDGRYYALGMGKAQPIELPKNRWLRDRAKYGISAARSSSGARQVIKFAANRKRRPVPESMRVVEVVGKGVIFMNKWRAVFRSIRLLDDSQRPDAPTSHQR